MPSLQSHKNAVCEVHLKVSTHGQRPTQAGGLDGVHIPGIPVLSLSLIVSPGIAS